MTGGVGYGNRAFRPIIVPLGHLHKGNRREEKAKNAQKHRLASTVNYCNMADRFWASPSAPAVPAASFSQTWAGWRTGTFSWQVSSGLAERKCDCPAPGRLLLKTASLIHRRWGEHRDAFLDNEAGVSLAVDPEPPPGRHWFGAAGSQRPIEALAAIGEPHAGQAGVVAEQAPEHLDLAAVVGPAAELLGTVSDRSRPQAEPQAALPAEIGAVVGGIKPAGGIAQLAQRHAIEAMQH
jgi:hypothetical protein